MSDCADKTPVWLRPGPAAKLYAHYRAHPPLREELATLVKQSWGAPEDPGLRQFPEVRREERLLTAAGLSVPATVFVPPTPTDDAFIYLHGGSWMAPAAGKHLAWAKLMAAKTRQKVYVVHYRLAPTSPFPAAVEDCAAAFRCVRAMTKGRVSLGGDSAGGNLGAAVVLSLADQASPRPDKLLALCPMMDLRLESYRSMREDGPNHPFSDIALLSFQRSCYAPDPDQWTHPYASPIAGNLTLLPRTLLLIAGEDPLRDDNQAFGEKCRAAGVSVLERIFPRMPHAFYTQPGFLPGEAADANQWIADFLRD